MKQRCFHYYLYINGIAEDYIEIMSQEARLKNIIVAVKWPNKLNSRRPSCSQLRRCHLSIMAYASIKQTDETYCATCNPWYGRGFAFGAGQATWHIYAVDL